MSRPKSDPVRKLAKDFFALTTDQREQFHVLIALVTEFTESAIGATPAVTPRRRGRPRKEAAPEVSPQ